MASQSLSGNPGPILTADSNTTDVSLEGIAQHEEAGPSDDDYLNGLDVSDRVLSSATQFRPNNDIG